MAGLPGVRNPSLELIVAISVVLADENAIVRRGLQALFDSEPDFVVVGVASDGLDVVRLAVKEFLVSKGRRPTCVQWQVPEVW